MSTRYYPLYQKGNPQLRIFLPNFWMKLVRSEEPLPPNVVLFQTSIQMTHYDVKNYLEKIYKVPVVDVKTTIKMGTIRPSYGKKYLVKEDDYKEALVTMPKDYTFEFPNVTFSQDVKKEMERYRKLRDSYKESKSKVDVFKDLPDWFK